ncbi:hypothetical protein [Streptomyces sp. ME18-1-4]|uniref:hypothetical protein n=1 Tax=Streptomyces sp. ME18-1-4 TaxID=3028685 RepID=UPI0029A6D1F6|nr:hypothetical protein [Streptomyces sp. ME18-1-4]MDX3245844.1 hypothetical protein [Streptomyces sp. ME18-1-4]
MTTFTDDFNRADGAPGANWVLVSGPWTIISQQLSSGTVGGTVIIRAATAMATNDNSAQVTITATGAVSHGVFCRANSTFTQGYLWRNDGTTWTLFSNVGGSFTSIGSFAGAAVAGDVAKVQAVGSTIKGLVNGIERVSVTNSAVATGTSVGLRAESTNLLRFDDFTGADVTSGATGDAALAATATLSATGLRTTSSDAALNTTATLTATGLRTTAGDTALAATATLTASGTITTSGTAALAATAFLTAAGQRTAIGDAALTAAATFTADGQRTTTADAGLAATATITAAGARTASAAAGLTATATLTATGTTALGGTAALAATATLTASGTTSSSHGEVTITVGTPYSPWTAGEAAGRWTAVETPGPWTAREATP